MRQLAARQLVARPLVARQLVARQLVARPLVAAALLVLWTAGSQRSAAAQSRPQPSRATDSATVLDPQGPSFDHSLFDALLRAHVRNGLVDYPAFRNNAEFTRYLNALKAADLKGFEEAEQIAFWLNVYNAYTIQLVASRGETASIRNINKALGIFRLKGPWSEDFVQAAGRTLTLDDVEHRILRHDYSEPRVHFAMSFGAVSAPRLRNEAYTGALLDDQLEDQAQTFIHDATKNRVDTSLFTVYLSPVIARYRTDFGESNQALARFLAEYYPPGPEKRFLTPPKPAPEPVVAVAPDSSVDKNRQPAATNNRPPRRPQFFYLRVVETPFDWTLNSQQRP